MTFSESRMCRSRTFSTSSTSQTSASQTVSTCKRQLEQPILDCVLNLPDEDILSTLAQAQSVLAAVRPPVTPPLLFGGSCPPSPDTRRLAEDRSHPVPERVGNTGSQIGLSEDDLQFSPDKQAANHSNSEQRPTEKLCKLSRQLS